MPKISLIIPVYNVEKFLPRLLDSVINQTFENFEAILVNDASTDNSGKICDEYAKKDNRIIVHHKAINEGVSSARNTGLDLAKGIYICFSDSDDCLEPFYLECLMNSSADFVIAGVKNLFSNGKVCTNLKYEKNFFDNIDLNLICKMIEDKSINYIYSKRFSSELIKRNQIRYANNLSLGEDTLFIAEYIIHCKSVEFLPKEPYFYYQNLNLSLSSFGLDYVNKLLIANDKIRFTLNQKFTNIETTEAWKKRIWSLFYYSIFQIIKSNLSFRKKVKSLNIIFKEHQFVDLSKNIDFFMQNDSYLLRKIISTRNASLVILFFKLSSLIN